MDSGNSGNNLQSSSGGDDEYDSRAAAHSLFMAFDSPSHLRPIYTAPPPFDPFSNYFQPLNPSMRLDPNPSTINPIIFQAPMVAAGQNNNSHLAAARNPRKRPRASRRAPTTVLTTDTTNFRAMVQEFTGIPAPPFNGLSFPRGRLDPFTTRSAASFEPPRPYLLRPFAPKAQSPPPFLLSSTANSITPANYQQQPITQNLNLFNVPNPNSLTSLLHSSPKFLFSESHDQDSFGIATSDNHQFGLSHHESTSPNGLPNLISPDHIGAQKDSNYDKNAETGTAVSGGYRFSPPPIGFRSSENVESRSQGMVESWISSSE